MNNFVIGLKNKKIKTIIIIFLKGEIEGHPSLLMVILLLDRCDKSTQ